MRGRQDNFYYQNTHFQQSVVIETTLIQQYCDLQFFKSMNLDNRLGFLPLIFIDIMIVFSNTCFPITPLP